MLQLVIVTTANCWHDFVSPTHLHSVCAFSFFGGGGLRESLAYLDSVSTAENSQSQRQRGLRQVFSPSGWRRDTSRFSETDSGTLSEAGTDAGRGTAMEL